VAPQEAIFIDDMAENVQAAAALGIHAIQFESREALCSELSTLLGHQFDGRDCEK
jgi:FMN phosphatase YigB (HAD superfamily)